MDFLSKMLQDVTFDKSIVFFRLILNEFLNNARAQFGSPVSRSRTYGIQSTNPKAAIDSYRAGCGKSESKVLEVGFFGQDLCFY